MNTTTFDSKTINECMCLHNSINYKKYKKKLLLFVYGMQHKLYTLPKKNKYLFMLLPELVREMSEFILDPISVGHYYKIMDNYNFNNPNIRWECSARFNARSKYFIGKILHIHRDPLAYLVSYLGWDESFNEYVTSKQIQKIDYTVSKYLLRLKENDELDCFNPITKRWHKGKVVHVHRIQNKIIGIDIISEYSNPNETKKKIYIYGQNIPIYSNCIMSKNFHQPGGYHAIDNFILAWAYKKYMLNKNKYFIKLNTSLENITIIDKHYVSFSVKQSCTPNWDNIKSKLGWLAH